MFCFISKTDLISINCILQRNYWNQPSLEYVKTKSGVPNIAAKKCRFITPRNAIPALQVSLQYNVSNFESFFLLLVHTAMAHSGCPNVKLSDCVYRHEECIGFLVKRSYTESHVNKTLLKNFIRWKLTTLKNKTWSSVSNSSLSKTFALCLFRKLKVQKLCFLPPNIVLGLKKWV